MGRYAAPDFNTPSRPTIKSGVRSIETPTTTPGPAPLGDQPAGELIRACVQLTIRQAQVSANDRQPIGILRGG